VTGLTLKSGQADTFVKKDAAASASLTGNTTWKLMGHSYAEAVALSKWLPRCCNSTLEDMKLIRSSRTISSYM